MVGPKLHQVQDLGLIFIARFSRAPKPELILTYPMHHMVGMIE